MTSTSLSLKEIYKLAYDSMISNGCNEENATALAKIVQTAERDGSHSHGLFRIPGYVKALRSGKVNGKARPSIEKIKVSSSSRIEFNFFHHALVFAEPFVVIVILQLLSFNFWHSL